MDGVQSARMAPRSSSTRTSRSTQPWGHVRRRNDVSHAETPAPRGRDPLTAHGTKVVRRGRLGRARQRSPAVMAACARARGCGKRRHTPIRETTQARQRRLREPTEHQEKDHRRRQLRRGTFACFSLIGAARNSSSTSISDRCQLNSQPVERKAILLGPSLRATRDFSQTDRRATAASIANLSPSSGLNLCINGLQAREKRPARGAGGRVRRRRRPDRPVWRDQLGVTGRIEGPSKHMRLEWQTVMPSELR